MKTILKVLLTLVFLVSFVCIFGESENAVAQLLWSGSWIAVCAVSGHFLYKLLDDDIKNEEV